MNSLRDSLGRERDATPAAIVLKEACHQGGAGLKAWIFAECGKQPCHRRHGHGDLERWRILGTRAFQTTSGILEYREGVAAHGDHNSVVGDSHRDLQPVA